MFTVTWLRDTACSHNNNNNNLHMHQQPSDRMFHNRAAKAVISLFNSLPAKSKPRLRDDVYEWVPLSGILVEDTNDQSLQVVSLATGNKVLPASKIGYV